MKLFFLKCKLRYLKFIRWYTITLLLWKLGIRDKKEKEEYIKKILAEN